MDYFPASWNLVKRSAGPLLGYAAGRFIEAYRGGQRAARAIDRDSSRPVTWQGSKTTYKMPYMRRPVSRRIARRYRRRYTRPSRPLTSYQTLVRTTGYNSLTINTGQFNAWMVSSVKLNNVRYDDLIAAYDLYRIKKVEVVCVSTFDPGNSGVVNNDHLQVIAACDPNNPSLPNLMTTIGAYDNSRSTWLIAGRKWVYTFYPKVTNTVYDGTVATNAGSYGVNPWLQLSPTGVGIPHYSLVMGLASATAPSVNNVLGVSYYYRIHFEVKNVC